MATNGRPCASALVFCFSFIGRFWFGFFVLFLGLVDLLISIEDLKLFYLIFVAALTIGNPLSPPSDRPFNGTATGSAIRS